jgi:hypothetical protein
MLKQEKTKQLIRKPSAERLVVGLRDTGYTINTAVADIIDNSVTAGATVINLSLYQRFGDLPELLIADNGAGMDAEGLENAMTYGSPKRPDPKSLGKFGLGLKTASTSFCRKLTVISRTAKETGYHCLQWDLDEIVKENDWVLLQPDVNTYQEETYFLEETTNGGHGTLIVWENIDRLVRPGTEKSVKHQLQDIAEDLRRHLSGVFFNFLSKGGEYPDISIIVNDVPLEPWDPFCRWLSTAEKKRVDVNQNRHAYTRETDGVKETIGEFTVNVYILPNQNELTKPEQDKMRWGLDNQGFYIFREGRMISSGGWPNRLFVKDPHLNLIRVELSFTHELDEYFQIDIKKSRIDLPAAIRERLKKVIAPAKNEANRRYRSGGKKSVNSQLGQQHEKSGNVINKHLDETTSSSNIESVNSQGEAEVKNRYGKTKVKLVFDDTQDCLVQTRPDLQDGVLWAPGLVEGNKHAVFLNETHEFYRKFYHANKDNAALIMAMDSVLWSLAEAELSVLSDTVKRNLEDLRISVSRSLRTLAVEMPEAGEEENEEEGGGE